MEITTALERTTFSRIQRPVLSIIYDISYILTLIQHIVKLYLFCIFRFLQFVRLV